MNVVPKRPPHKLNRGEEMEKNLEKHMYGNTTVYIDWSYAKSRTDEEIKQTEREIHLAAWAIIEECAERGEDI